MNSSGLNSDLVYVHGRPFTRMLSEYDIWNAVEQMALNISRDYADKNPLCIGVLNGSFVFAADLIRSLTFDPEIAFIKVASYQQMQSTGAIRELIGLDIDIRARDILVIEDIIDTGHTISYLNKLLIEREAASVRYATLLLKPDAYQYDIPIDYIGFNIPNQFVIGYGLDYNGHGRALRGIYVLSEN